MNHSEEVLEIYRSGTWRDPNSAYSGPFSFGRLACRLLLCIAFERVNRFFCGHSRVNALFLVLLFPICVAQETAIPNSGPIRSIEEP